MEIYRACAPALAASGGLWVGISTGYRKIGLLYQRWRDNFGVGSDDVLVVQGDSATLNPTLDAGMIARAKQPILKQRSPNGAVVFVATLPRFSMMA